MKSVLITGASSGIGFATAIYLDGLGIKVYAGVRKDSDGLKLKEVSSDKLCPVIMDLCDHLSVKNAFTMISEKESADEFSLVNNAGLSLNGPLELLNFEKIKKLIDVNVNGLLFVTQTFLSLIRANKGRLINISSGHGLVGVPDKSVYAASKFAVQAISSSLRTELRPFGVKVSNIVVGKINTKVLGKILSEREEMIQNSDPSVYALYRTQIEYFDKEVKNLPGIEAVEVAKIIARAINDKNPKPQYLVGPGARKMKILARFSDSARDNMLYKAIHK